MLLRFAVLLLLPVVMAQQQVLPAGYAGDVGHTVFALEVQVSKLVDEVITLKSRVADLEASGGVCASKKLPRYPQDPVAITPLMLIQPPGQSYFLNAMGRPLPSSPAMECAGITVLNPSLTDALARVVLDGLTAGIGARVVNPLIEEHHDLVHANAHAFLPLDAPKDEGNYTEAYETFLEQLDRATRFSYDKLVLVRSSELLGTEIDPLCSNNIYLSVTRGIYDVLIYKYFLEAGDGDGHSDRDLGGATEKEDVAYLKRHIASTKPRSRLTNVIDVKIANGDSAESAGGISGVVKYNSDVKSKDGKSDGRVVETQFSGGVESMVAAVNGIVSSFLKVEEDLAAPTDSVARLVDELAAFEAFKKNFLKKEVWKERKLKIDSTFARYL
jgi:hypothetical protein